MIPSVDSDMIHCEARGTISLYDNAIFFFLLLLFDYQVLHLLLKQLSR
jgi:hypothetical protein